VQKWVSTIASANALWPLKFCDVLQPAEFPVPVLGQEFALVYFCSFVLYPVTERLSAGLVFTLFLLLRCPAKTGEITVLEYRSTRSNYELQLLWCIPNARDYAISVLAKNVRKNG